MKAEKHPRGETLLAYADGELPPQEAATVSDHCARCDDCRRELAGLQEVARLLAVDAAPEIPAPVWPRLAARRQSESEGLRLGPAFALGSAAVCAAGLVLGLVIGQPAPSAAEQSATATWVDSGSLWTGSSSSSLLDVFSGDQTEEGSGES